MATRKFKRVEKAVDAGYFAVLEHTEDSREMMYGPYQNRELAHSEGKRIEHGLPNFFSSTEGRRAR